MWRRWPVYTPDSHRKPRGIVGFTLVELMIVISILGILATIAIPKFANMLRNSREGATMGNLGLIRSALNIYYADMDGFSPCAGQIVYYSCVESLTINGKYLNAVPPAEAPYYHPPTNLVSATALDHLQTYLDDYGDWIYIMPNTIPPVGVTASDGSVYLTSVHTDTKGTLWSTY